MVEATKCSYVSQDVYRTSGWPNSETLPWDSDYTARRGSNAREFFTQRNVWERSWPKQSKTGPIPIKCQAPSHACDASV